MVNPRQRFSEVILIFFLFIMVAMGLAGADVDECSECDSRFVNLDGDNMTGVLNVSEITGLNVLVDEVYYVDTDAELDAAIQEIGDNDATGYIHILADLTDVAVLMDDSDEAAYIFDLHGHELDSNVGLQIIRFFNGKFLIVKNGILDFRDATTSLHNVILIKSSGAPVWLQNLKIYGDGTNGIIHLQHTENVIIKDCEISDMYIAIYSNNASESSFINNRIHDMLIAGIYLTDTNENKVAFNQIHDINATGVPYIAAGIYIDLYSDNNIITGNFIDNINGSPGLGGAWGIRVAYANAHNTLIDGNIIKNCTTASISDSGTDTLIGDNVT